MNECKAYPTDLSDKQWELIEPLLPKKKQGRDAIHSRREMMNALLYIARTGCQWRMLPPWEAVYAFLRRLVERNLLEKINDALRVQIREEEDREADPSVVIVDSQSVQTAEKRGRWVSTRISSGKAASDR